MSEPAAPPPAPLLSYAVDRDAYGVVVERRPGRTSFAIPPVSRWRDLPSDDRLGNVLMSLMLAGTAFGNVVSHLLLPSLIWSAAALAWMLTAWWRWRRWVVVVVTPTHVILRRGLSPDRGAERRWPRGPGLSLALSFDATQLVVRKAGEEMELAYLGRRLSANRHMIADLQAALTEPMAEAVDPADPPPPKPPGQMADLADAAIAGGMILIVLWGAWAPVLWIGVIPLAIIAGLRFGTQNRTAWP